MNSNTEAFIDTVANYFDQLVPIATDDELFASGYLRGHFDLAVGTLQVSGAPFQKQDVVEQVSSSLQQAIAKGELDQTDELSVQTLWQQLQQIPV